MMTRDMSQPLASGFGGTGAWKRLVAVQRVVSDQTGQNPALTRIGIDDDDVDRLLTIIIVCHDRRPRLPAPQFGTVAHYYRIG